MHESDGSVYSLTTTQKKNKIKFNSNIFILHSTRCMLLIVCVNIRLLTVQIDLNFRLVFYQFQNNTFEAENTIECINYTRMDFNQTQILLNEHPFSDT